MEAVLGWVYAIWSQYPTMVLLYSAFLVHYSLALWALWQRRSLRLRSSELIQLVFGFAIPILLVAHVVNTRVAHSFFDVVAGYYAFELWVFFVYAPEKGIWQLVALVVAWTHAMIGLNAWLRIRPWYERWRSLTLVAAVLTPVLSILGAVQA